jgi:nucleoside-diphosphate-sugar epimerase
VSGGDASGGPTPLSDLASERFLVTGSEGCIGSWVVRTLVLAGATVVALDLGTSGTRLRKILDDEHVSAVTFLAGDIAEPGVVENAIKEHGSTRVIHLAALQVPFVAATPVRGGLVNVMGTLCVLEAVRCSQPQVRGLAYASSMAVFGSIPDTPPETLYGVFKVCNEETARFYARDYETPSVGLRPCVVYGPARDQGLTAAISHAMKAATLGVPYEIPFGGSVDLQYAEDVARSFIASSLLDTSGEALVFDLHGESVSIERVISTIEQIEPAAAGLLTHRPEQIPGRVDVDDAPLLAALGYPLEKLDFTEGTRRTLAAFSRLKSEGLLSVDEIPALQPG